jgi:hypothetical protein
VRVFTSVKHGKKLGHAKHKPKDNKGHAHHDHAAQPETEEQASRRAEPKPKLDARKPESRPEHKQKHKHERKSKHERKNGQERKREQAPPAAVQAPPPPVQAAPPAAPPVASVPAPVTEPVVEDDDRDERDDEHHGSDKGDHHGSDRKAKEDHGDRGSKHGKREKG